ncbi:hypothetical protein PR048_026103 [Dryococelus australis]|uniref:Uncharacterized protein n=1 Tax=Dryococelus australis TaxID=614101 RepID=A0ABQ9GKG8_9NEOP|nr:hypothetical protein PR048_026103 [Dryococelus australis]
MLEQWDSLPSYFNFEFFKPPYEKKTGCLDSYKIPKLFCESPFPQPKASKTATEPKYSQEPQIHVLLSLVMEMFKDVITRFVNPTIVKNPISPLEVEYQKGTNRKRMLTLQSEILLLGQYLN